MPKRSLQALHLRLHARAHRRIIIGNGRGRLGHVELDHRVVQFAALQLAAEHLARLLAGVLAGQRLDHPVLGGAMRLGAHLLAHPRAGFDDGGIDQIADDAVHVAADIADFGELRRLDLQERRAGELGQPAADLGLADAGRADHQDVLGIDLVAQVGRKLAAPPAVAQRHGDGPLGFVLADDVAVEFGDDLARGQGAHGVSA